MVKRDITLAASLAPLAALGLGAAEEAAAQVDSAYDPVGVPAGGFRLFPEVTASVESTDNVLATAANEQSDYLYQLLPSARLESDWNSHQLNLHVEAASRFYSDFSDQDSTDVSGGLDARLDVDRSFNFTLNAGLGDLTEPLANSPSSAQLAEPVQFMRSDVALGVVKAFNQLSVSAKAGITTYDYEDGLLAGGGALDQDDRDRDMLFYGFRADYAVSPATSLFFAATGNQREYDQQPPAVPVSRDSDGYDVIGGVKFEATSLIQGEIGVGYLSQTYDEAGAPEVDGLAVRAALDWAPDELVNVRIAAERAVRDAGAAGAVGYVANDFTFGVDYAIRRNIDIGLQARYSRDEYNDVDREDKRWSFEGSIDYALNRVAAIFVSAGHDQQESSGAALGREFEINRATIGLRLRR